MTERLLTLKDRWGSHVTEYESPVKYLANNGNLPPTKFLALGEEEAWGGQDGNCYTNVHPRRIIGIMTGFDGKTYECEVHPSQLEPIK